jgi:hypothetical protein
MAMTVQVAMVRATKRLGEAQATHQLLLRATAGDRRNNTYARRCRQAALELMAAREGLERLKVQQAELQPATRGVSELG